MAEIKNLGLVKAIFVSGEPPVNKSILWLDTSLSTPLHKFYNTSSSSWEPLIQAALIDNYTIKKNVDDELYVDLTVIPELTIADGSIGLIKLEDVASGTIFYRKTVGDGPPEVQTLATLKTDLGLQGTNTGDQDLSGYVLKITTINGKALTGNIILTPSDIGSPSGSGTSTGTNTGDETKISILEKLEIESISGVNTGDETYESILDLFGITAPEEQYYLLSETERNRLLGSANVYTISLSSSTTVDGRILGATEGVDYPNGWLLEASDVVDLKITHNLDKHIANVTVWGETLDGYRQKFNNAAYSGILEIDSNILKIEALATVESPIRIQLTFA